MKILVAGSGGREHAISWALARSKDVDEVICVPGNGGTAAEPRCRNYALQKGESLAAAALRCTQAEKPAFVVIGPEEPLAEGLADRLREKGVPAVGPVKNAAILESSKDIAKAFMKKYGVSCAGSEAFVSAEEALAYIRTAGADRGSSSAQSSVPLVVKADGLAAGKGVVVAADAHTAEKAVRSFMIDGSLGSAGKRIIIEEYLQGVEISILAAVSTTPETAASGKACIVPFIPARDHKRLEEGAQGPNTGGMGAVAPVPDVTEETLTLFNERILEPTLRGLIAEKMDYRGFIFFGLMLTAQGPKLLEYNVRLGDPETQAVLPLLDCDFAGLCSAILDGTLADFPIAWKQGAVCAPVAVVSGYPGPYKKGITIHIDEEEVRRCNAKIFVAGAVSDTNILKTSGGRVLCASALGRDGDEARLNAYHALKAVSFDGMFFRSDIGLPGAAESGIL